MSIFSEVELKSSNHSFCLSSPSGFGRTSLMTICAETFVVKEKKSIMKTAINVGIRQVTFLVKYSRRAGSKSLYLNLYGLL